MTIEFQATIILLFTYSIKPFPSAAGKGESRLFARELAERDILAANPASRLYGVDKKLPLQQKSGVVRSASTQKIIAANSRESVKLKKCSKFVRRITT